MLIHPITTEKTAALASKGTYVFRVSPDANKIEIAKQVKERYKVNVQKVRIISVKSKARRVGRTVGKKRGFKKALVSIAKGQRIEI